MTSETAQICRAPGRGIRACRTGTVVSVSGEKTIKVRCDYLMKHRAYGKYMRRSSTLHTHDGKNEAKVGDVVDVIACRRMSKTKFWRLSRIVRRA